MLEGKIHGHHGPQSNSLSLDDMHPQLSYCLTVHNMPRHQFLIVEAAVDYCCFWVVVGQGSPSPIFDFKTSAQAKPAGGQIIFFSNSANALCALRASV